MISIDMVEAKLPPGFRFHPRDDELICDYLAAKTAAVAFAGSCLPGHPSMVDVDLNKCEPWDLPASACVGGKEWYFYSLRDRKYATGQRTNRATTSGYWKATGKDRPVARRGAPVGMRKTLVFYRGRAPKGKKTDWVMHEFRMDQHSGADPNNMPFQGDWVLCKVFNKSRSTSSTAAAASHDGEYSSHHLQTLIRMNGFGQVPCFSSLDPGRVSQHHPRPHAAAAAAAATSSSHLLPSMSSGGGGDVPQIMRGVKGGGEEGGVGCALTQSGLPLSWNPFLGFGGQS